MKIVQIMPEFGLAGAERMCENLSLSLHRMGHQVIVISMYDYTSPITERLTEAGIDVRYLGKKPGLDLSMIKKMRKIFAGEKPDVVHTHLYSIKYAVPAAVLARCTRRVHTVHNMAEKECGKYARIINKFFFRFHGVIPVSLSELIQATVCKEYQLPKERVPIVFNGIDLSECEPKITYDMEDKIKILHIGRFSDQKNHSGLIEAFEMFHRKYPDSELQLIGAGAKEEEIRKLVQEKKLQDCVLFLGVQSRVYSYLHEADIFVLPSLYEGIPMTLAEAMGTGLPIVATAVGGVPDMLGNNEFGILTETESEKIASALMQLAENKELRASLGRKAREASEKFSSTYMAKGYCDIYEKSAERNK